MKPPQSQNLTDPKEGDPISAEQASLQNEILRRELVIPNSVTDSIGTRQASRRKGKPGINSDLYWCMLMENHPGRGKCFDMVIGEWCSGEHKFRFDCDATEFETGIDWHYGVPYPDKYAQGWFQRMPSDWTDSGYIYVCVSLDCESDDDCAAHDLPCDTPETDPCGA